MRATICLLVCTFAVIYASSVRPVMEGLTFHHRQVDGPVHPIVKDWIDSRRVESQSRLNQRQDVDINQVINIAKQVWNIIQKGETVLNTTFDYATAVPKGIKEWTELEHWTEPVTGAYSVWVENLFKHKIVEINYTVVATPNGQYQGKGQYLTNIGIIPTYVHSMWGLILTASTNTHGLVNVGSHESPIAAIQVDLNWIVDWRIKKFTKTEAYYVRGDGKPITTLN
ncbi:hypothetical protein PROFUN_00176 [Planoprotostelium fungivorum]|uniref:Uncharacterized protein n=1 Tax=Planoprotostelium fungivorum TaxID=1890364 RepID=A0A2P6P0V2_9EUKA|nr:hypothetical protein PROFUN_00176 [Planoprotostelium fungivorum]